MEVIEMMDLYIIIILRGSNVHHNYLTENPEAVQSFCLDMVPLVSTK